MDFKKNNAKINSIVLQKKIMKNTKTSRIISVLTGTILMLVIIMSSAQAMTLFQDVIGDKNQLAIQDLQERGIISGYPDGTFKPDQTLNRAELIKILVGGTGIQPLLQDYKSCFPDVQFEWFAPYVCYAKNKGWVQGYPDGTFKPGKTVNKVEAIKMLVNSQGYELPTIITGVIFEDVDNTAWYAAFIKVAKEKGLLEETGTKFSPAGDMERGAISENIYRAIQVTELGTTKYTNSLPTL